MARTGARPITTDGRGSEAPKARRLTSRRPARWGPLALEPAAEPAQASDVSRERVRRVVNVVLAVVALIVAAPFMLLIAVLIKLTAPGPVLYTQPRIGTDRRDEDAHSGAGRGNDRRQMNLGGRIFTIYKFRTMRVGSDDRGQVWARPDDDRVTLVGGFLRKYHLDELPQLFNVLNGDMNLVGPRPEQPAIFCELSDEIPDYPRRQRVPPGLTGWAQIQHHYDRSLDDVRRKLELDLEYLQRRSSWGDVMILARTVPAVVLGDEAKGW